MKTFVMMPCAAMAPRIGVGAEVEKRFYGGEAKLSDRSGKTSPCPASHRTSRRS
jgi:hypothetical protein